MGWLLEHFSALKTIVCNQTVALSFSNWQSTGEHELENTAPHSVIHSPLSGHILGLNLQTTRHISPIKWKRVCIKPYMSLLAFSSSLILGTFCIKYHVYGIIQNKCLTTEGKCDSRARPTERLFCNIISMLIDQSVFQDDHNLRLCFSIVVLSVLLPHC